MTQRGKLKVYLGFAPGVGKTYAMLNEAHDLARRGHDVVIGLVEHHGRQRTKQLIEGLPVIPRKTVIYRGSRFSELDTDAIIARNPEVVLVDELAHTVIMPGNVSEGVTNPKRWHDVYALLDAGIDVISTMNIQHLESLNDVVAAVTGTRQRETVPDQVLRDADEIELVDLSPDALRLRMARGEIYARQQAELALEKYFRAGNLTALRELTLLWLADKVDEVLEKYRREQDINEQWLTRERVIVAVQNDASSETLIRRGARVAGRVAGREMIVVHVASEEDEIDSASLNRLKKLQDITESLGGQWRTIVGDNVAETLLEFARTVNASQLVIGLERGVRRYSGSAISSKVIDEAGPIDIHIVSTTKASSTVHRARHRLPTIRQATGWATAVCVPPLLTEIALKLQLPQEFLGVLLLSYLTIAVFAALAGGLLPSIFAVISGSLLANWFFTEPTHTLTVTRPESLAQIVIFFIIAITVASVVEVSERRRREAKQRLGQAVILSDLARGVVHDGDNITQILQRLRETFTLKRVDLQRYSTQRKKWLTIATTAQDGISTPWPKNSPFSYVSTGSDMRFVLSGKNLAAAEIAMIEAHGARILALLDREEIDAMRRATAALEAGNRMASAVLTGVSHDLRTPLASIKAAVSSLNMTDVELDQELEHELLESIESSADRLEGVIGNLLDASRVNSNSLSVLRIPVNIDDVIDSVTTELPEAAEYLDRNVFPDTPDIDGDPGLIQRILANLVINGRKYAPESRLLIDAKPSQLRNNCVDISVIDHGPGIPADRLSDIFLPFQRVGDMNSKTQGLGLGLAAASRFADTMNGTIRAENTPGGGATFVLTLPAIPGSYNVRQRTPVSPVDAPPVQLCEKEEDHDK